MLVALVFVSPASEESWTSGLGILAINVLNTGAAIGVVLFPTLVWRDKIRSKKARELALVQRAVDGDRNALQECEMAEQIGDYDLVQLLSYRREIEALSDFPFTASHARWLILYLLVPPLSWMASALAERVVDAMIG